MKITYLSKLCNGRSGLVIHPWEIEDGEEALVLNWFTVTVPNWRVRREGETLYTKTETNKEWNRGWNWSTIKFVRDNPEAYDHTQFIFQII